VPKTIVVQRTNRIIGRVNPDGSHQWPDRMADGTFYNPAVKSFSVKYLDDSEFVVVPPGIADVMFIGDFGKPKPAKSRSSRRTGEAQVKAEQDNDD